MARVKPPARTKGKQGAFALEYALVLPVLLLFVLGTIDVSRFLFTQANLDRASQFAARCAAVDPVMCGNADSIRARGVSAILGLNLAPSAFIVTAEVCGLRVTAHTTFAFFLPGFTPVEMAASACYPA